LTLVEPDLFCSRRHRRAGGAEHAQRRFDRKGWLAIPVNSSR
jgi:hypothetical protein